VCVRRFIRAAGISECSAAAALSGIVSAMADLPLVDVATGLDGRHGACRRHRFFSPSSQRLLLAVSGALLRACGRLCTVQVASFAIGRLGDL